MSSGDKGLQKAMVAARTARKRSRSSALRDCLGERCVGCVSMMRSGIPSTIHSMLLALGCFTKQGCCTEIAWGDALVLLWDVRRRGKGAVL